MAKNQNTFAKRQREADKKRKAQNKRDRRETRKDAPAEPARETAPEPETNP